MLPGSLPLPKGASLAEAAMHHAAASAAPPSLIDVRHVFARGGAAGGKASSKLSTRPDDRAHGPSGAAGPGSQFESEPGRGT